MFFKSSDSKLHKEMLLKEKHIQAVDELQSQICCTPVYLHVNSKILQTLQMYLNGQDMVAVWRL